MTEVEQVTGRTFRQKGDPTRQCAVTRERMAIENLLRFVADPDGRIVPDVACRLPGRGVWVVCEQSQVAAAVKANVFARSLRQKVLAEANLPLLVQQLLHRRVLEMLSMVKKAGQIVNGYAKVDVLIRKGKAAALIHAADGAEDGCGKLSRLFRNTSEFGPEKARIINCFESSELSLAIGGSNVVHAALKDGGASQKFLDEADRLVRYACGPT